MQNQAELFALCRHVGTNHMYDKYLPYEFHLRMVVKTANKFLYLVNQDDRQTVLDACWLHDVIEDTRTNYNEVASQFSCNTAEILRAVTNDQRGRNRAERMPASVYVDIYKVPLALFVKLCDRIANVEYSKMTGSSMFEKYKKEHPEFCDKLHAVDDHKYNDMWVYLDELFE